MSLGDYQDPFGGNGASLAEGADVSNGSYDYVGAPGGIVYARDHLEQNQMGAGYPQNGQSWDVNAAFMGLSRLIDAGTRGYAVAHGMAPATYAGQNGLTYANGQLRVGANMGGMLPLLAIAAAVYLIVKK
jgi:hypothetical protein